ncbi:MULTISPECIES: divisome protein SepX/GlpR [unclassified Nocardioides]|uniref:divisome protein SepX/GlpR n=1 Tax=unclassified Nocardioides TaxID=2615069 RepID=UPI00070188AF|nr:MULTISPECIES: hypothetical protein [unclassified Nocardioides]KRA31063.1 hypothetical protein ASD81_16360 [Nocardioides sp. Root614]KRA87683.1 hypothetical protein ASD84_16630 [Nocardioides sp. Root682]
MDLSALIFVALAVAWAVYLVPKALKQHEEDADSRSVEGFSDRLRVLARRDAVSATEAALVPAGRTSYDAYEPAADAVPEAELPEDVPATAAPAPRARPTEHSPVQRRLRQAAARRAAERRRRVFNILLLAIIVTVALSIGGVIGATWILGPLVLMGAWLVACRLMVKRERAARAATSVRKRRRTLADEVIAAEDADDADDLDDESDNTQDIPVVTAALADEPVAVDPDAWTPVPVPLPTYVDKAPAGRTVRTIDLDSTGVWSSGRNEADSQLAREADAQRTKAEPDAEQQRRASGS